MEVLWANVDGAAHGWCIAVVDDTNLVVQVTDAAPSVKGVTFDLTPFLGELVLATLAVSANTLRLYINATLAGSIALNGGGVVPAAGSKATVGVGTTAHTSPALTCEIAGVGYRDSAVTAFQMVQMFEAAQ